MLKSLGVRLHPDEITEAWYGAGCPPRLDTRGLSPRVRLQWWLACRLRGVRA